MLRLTRKPELILQPASPPDLNREPQPMTIMNTTTRFARILIGYVTIGIVFGIALSGGPCGKNAVSKPAAPQALSKPVACSHLEQPLSLLSYVSHAAGSQSPLAD